MEEPEITIKLARDETTSLSDWRERLQMTDLSSTVDDPAAWAPIHRIAGQLDKVLPALFFADYDVRLEEARRRLRPTPPRHLHLQDHVRHRWHRDLPDVLREPGLHLEELQQ
ncbi:hypothetical protein [Streptomyces sp. NK08204]|uniref:hypothetical protein n=1 Tax=Streptomyces sp. NK08204 TaxID=2873260 RepID=UPI0027E37474|nr:hypothetical protein [Streptomyces sp. NK08204]